MDIFNVLSLIGGLCLFLFGMNIMGESLERRAGSGLRAILSRLTSNRFAGLLTGLAVTAIMQSSSATTVMVVGFVNSGLMTLSQSIYVIMGANIGTTVTGWILSLAGINGENFFINLLKPSSFTPVLALVGVVFYMFFKNDRKKDTGMILLGFATLMYGMEAMSASVSGLADMPEFTEVLLMFSNPLLGVLVGAVFTAIIQSSSASVGILQALSTTGQITYGTALPIVLGQNIGACATALLSSVGTNRKARCSALVHLCFNVLGTVIILIAFYAIRAILAPAILLETASPVGIAIVNTGFNVICTAIFMPMGNLLEKLVLKLIRDDGSEQKFAAIDERLLTTPSLALQQSREMVSDMAATAVKALDAALAAVEKYTDDSAAAIRKAESDCDKYEDILGSYLVKLSSQKLSAQESEEAAALLKLIGDYERISDHAVNILESAEEMHQKNLNLSGDALREYGVLSAAVANVLDISLNAFVKNDVELAFDAEPLEQVIDRLKEDMRTRHIMRMQRGECSIETGFIWSDLLTNIERTSDHCSNIAACIIDISHHNLDLHKSQKAVKHGDPLFDRRFEQFSSKYSL